MKAFGYEWLRAAIAPVSPYGEARFRTVEPFAPGEEAAAQAHAIRVARVAECMSVAQLDAAREIMRNASDAGAAVARASMGDVLDDANFLELQRFFDACERLNDLTSTAADLPRTVAPELSACARALELGRAGRFGFFLDDGFAVELRRARAVLTQAQAEYDAAQGRAYAAVARALGREVSLPEFIVMRADLNGELPAGVRVVRETPTYVLCELDADEPVLAALGRRDAAAAHAALEEESVRARLSSVMRMHAAALDAAMRAFGEVDVLIAAARFAQLHRCSIPRIASGAGLAFEAGRYLPLQAELEAQGRTFTPIDVELDGVAVLTGPNMGGKSAALRTCGFIAMCARFGLPVPARNANVALFAAIDWLGIDAEEGAQASLLSSFAREVVALREALANAAHPRLVLLDEFARTTTPREGKALLIALIARLGARGICGLAATHLDGVAEAAGVKHYAVRGLRGIPQRPPAGDLRQALETLAASMDYTLAEVGGERASGADAIALAALLGLDPELVRGAYAALEE